MGHDNNHKDIDNIVSAISSRILRGEYRPGDKLSENSLATEFQCSRTPIREALKRIEGEGLVDIQPYSGTYVRSFTLEESLEITEIRAYLESLAFALASERCSDVEILELLSEQMEAILRSPQIDFVLFGKTHYHFHRQIVLMSGNSKLRDLYASLNIGFASVFYKSMDAAEIEMTIEEHKKIVELMREHRTEEGKRFMYEHLWNKRARILNGQKES